MADLNAGKVRVYSNRISHTEKEVGYLIDEVLVGHSEVKTKHAITANRYQAWVKDIEYCESALAQYIAIFPDNEGDDDRRSDVNALSLRALFISAVVTYCKAVGGGGFHPPHIFSGSNARYLKFHQWIDDMRDTFVAHNGQSELQDSTTVLLFPQGKSDQITSHAEFLRLMPLEAAKSFASMLKVVGQYARQKSYEACKATMKDLEATGELELHRRNPMAIRTSRMNISFPSIE